MQPLFHSPNPLMALGLVLTIGVLAGGAARRLRLPSVTGQILAGIVIGPVALHLVDEHSAKGLQSVTHFALGLMAVTVGAHLNVKTLVNAGRRLAFLLLCEALLIPLVVLGIMRLVPGVPTPVRLLLAAIAVSTAPATIVALVREARAKGVFVKTLIAAVALNNLACILLFEAVSAYLAAPDAYPTIAARVGAGIRPVGLALMLGGGAALLLRLVARALDREQLIATAGMITILLTAGVADHLHVSPLLACLTLGVAQSNLTPVRERVVDTVFQSFEPSIMAVFFTLAGMELRFDGLAMAGAAAATYFVARAVGKLLAVRIAMQLARAPDKLKRYLGLALIPQAGLAIGLVLLVEDRGLLKAQPAAQRLFMSIVLTVVMANEIIGPVLTRLGLRQSGEAGRDRARLIDFLQEENILVDFDAPDKNTAIRMLVDHLMSSHHVRNVNRDELLASVLQREAQATTCLGGGLAVPHGILPDGHPMVGVMAVSRKGMMFDAPDEQPVHWMVLLGTPEDSRDRHLNVLATLARTIGMDADIQRALLKSDSPAHAYEILHGEETEDFNFYLKD
ncbi:MAG: cation:proton antiporter [Polyangiaceae bacterium]